MLNLKSYIRDISDWPTPGVIFKDITPLLQDKDALKEALDGLTQLFLGEKIDMVVGIDARGFLLASTVAYKLGTGLALVRKKGKLPSKAISQEYTLEYGSNTIEIHDDAIKPGQRVLVVDDVLATGGTMMATCELIEKLGGQVVGVAFLMTLDFLGGREKLKKYTIKGLLNYNPIKTTRAEIGIFGGSGFYSMFEGEVEEVIMDTPYGPTSDKITIGEIAGHKTAFLPRHGAHHQHAPHTIPYLANLWAMKELGATKIIAPNAAGSLARHVKPGDFVICDQFVDRTSGRPSTFYNGPEVKHVSTADPYCPELRALAIQSAISLGIPVHNQGTMVVVQGPRFSTRAESKWYQQAGFEVIGMTQYPEATLARELAMCYVNISLITDYDTGVDGIPPVDAKEVGKIFADNIDKVKMLIKKIISELPATPSCNCRKALENAVL